MYVQRRLRPWEIDYCYISWSKDQDEAIRQILPSKEPFHMIVFGKLVQNRKTVKPRWKRRRISIGAPMKFCFEGCMVTISDIPKCGEARDGKVHIWSEDE